LPIFEKLSKKIDTDVVFTNVTDKNRFWKNNLKNYKFRKVNLEKGRISSLITGIHLINKMIKKRYDLYIAGESPDSIFTLLILFTFAKIKKIPFVIWQGETKQYSFHTKNIIKRAMEKIYRNSIYQMIDAFISYSKETDKFLFSFGVPKEKIFTGTQIMPKELLPRPTIKQKPKEFLNKTVFLYLGYLNERKGIDDLINAFNMINEEKSILLIVGAGKEEEKLKKLASENKKIIFKPYAEGTNKANYYSMADCFVFPTKHDVWGFVVNEALYYNLPVISSDAAAASELIKNGKNGYVFPAGNVKELKEKMNYIIKNSEKVKDMKENIKKSDKSKIVDINLAVKTFENAINYALKNHETNKTKH
jgi:glycosyltransferase involved in cell wall biosynthesis